MKQWCCVVLTHVCLAVWCGVALAEPVTTPENQAVSDTTSEAQRQEVRERLTRQRQALEAQYKQDMLQCYQNFDVTRCRLQARDRRIEANAVLRQEELRFNAQERRIQADQAQRSQAERTHETEKKRADAERAASVAASKERADAHAQKQIDHALQGTKRGDYEQKQREAAQRRIDVEKKLRERNKEPAAPLPAPSP